jgi:hypothetical protein
LPVHNLLELIEGHRGVVHAPTHPPSRVVHDSK